MIIDRFKRAIAIAVIMLGASVAQGARAESLTDALIAAYLNSNLLEQNRALLRVADEDVAQAVSALRPIISFIANAGYAEPRPTSDNFTASIALTAEITLYDGGASRLGIDAAKESVLATREGLLQVEQNVLLDAVSAYMQVIQTSQFVALAQSNVRLITQELRAANDRFEVGEVTRTDVAIAQASLAAARSNLAAAEGNFNVAREAFKAATGKYPGNLTRPRTPPVTAKSLDQAIAIAERSHPLIKQLQRQVTVTRTECSDRQGRHAPEYHRRAADRPGSG